MGYFCSCREVLAQWSTRDTLTPRVEWGVSPGLYTSSAPAHSVTYYREEMCDPPAKTVGWVPPGMLHRAAMSGTRAGKNILWGSGRVLDVDTCQGYFVNERSRPADNGVMLTCARKGAWRKQTAYNCVPCICVEHSFVGMYRLLDVDSRNET